MAGDLEAIKSQIWRVIEDAKNLADGVGKLACLCLEHWSQQAMKTEAQSCVDESKQFAGHLMTRGQTANYLQVSMRSIDLWVKNDGLPCRIVGNDDPRFDREEVDEWTKRSRNRIAKPELRMVQSARS